MTTNIRLKKEVWFLQCLIKMVNNKNYMYTLTGIMGNTGIHGIFDIITMGVIIALL
jgi:hypothetical protein